PFPGNHAPLRAQARRGGAASDVPLERLFLRLPVGRRQGPHRKTCAGTPRRAGGISSGENSHPAPCHRRQGSRASLLRRCARARPDPATGGFVMLGKTFKGMTDKMLAWQTQRLLELETSREGHVVHVRPALVAEVAFNEIQASPTYPGGFALRFARVKRYREDKSATEADTIETVRALYEGQISAAMRV